MKRFMLSFTHKNTDAPHDTQPSKIKKLINTGNVGFYFILAFLLLIVLECFARRSLIDGLLFPFRNIVAFLANYAIIVITLLPALLCKRRIALLTLICSIWVSLGITQFVLTSFRVTPLTAVDFTILPNVITIIDVYLKPYQLVLIIALLLVAIAAIIMMFIKLPKKISLSFDVVFLLKKIITNIQHGNPLFQWIPINKIFK